MGIFYTMEGIGSLLGTALLHLVAPFWLSNMTDYGNINDNHLDFYLYFLGVLQVTTFIIYCGALYMQKFSLRPIVMPPPRRGRGRRRHDETGAGGRDIGAQSLIEEEDEDDFDEEAEDEDLRQSDTQQLLWEVVIFKFKNKLCPNLKYWISETSYKFFISVIGLCGFILPPYKVPWST